MGLISKINGIFSGGGLRINRLPVKRNIIIYAVIIITVSFAFFFYFQHQTEQSIRESMLEQQKQNQKDNTRALAQHIRSDMNSIMGRLQGMSHSIYLQQGDFTSNYTKSVLKNYFRQMNYSTPVDRLFILDANGIVKMNIVPEGQPTFLGERFSFEWVKETSNTMSPQFSDGFVGADGQYRIAVTENASYHFYHSVGIAGNIGAKKMEAPKVVEVPVISDRDGDGIVDSSDACPDQAGTAALQGCPDRDGDGIADKDDKCPDVAGLAKYQGCPIPDTDKDGINDEEDKCPDVPGVARYQGCPIPDTDKDGVNDEEDKCPNEAGPASNFGCPVIDVAVVEKVNKAAKNIFFATGSSKLLAKSYASLKEVAQILKDNPSYKVDVDGYTDITGNADKNQVLSENRANSVKTYLVSNGIDESRITATGHGINDPIADNKTAAGRAKNRRVEMKLRNY